MKTTIRIGLITTLICITLMAGVTYWAAQNLPADDIPLHWNAAGEVDRWGTYREAMMALLIIPAIGLLTGLLLAVVPFLDPRRANLIKSSKVYLISWIASMILLAGVHAGVAYMTVTGARGEDAPALEFVRFVIAGTALLIIILGNYLPKTRPNWFLGIRTPWTLSSDNSWEKTHRVGGRLFMLVGLITLISAFTLQGISLALLTPALMMSVVLFCVVYSYLVWRRSDDRRTETDYIV